MDTAREGLTERGRWRDWNERIVCLMEVLGGGAPRRRKNKNQHTTQHHDARMMTTVIIAWQPSWRNKLWRVERKRIWGTGLDAGGDVTGRSLGHGSGVPRSKLSCSHPVLPCSSPTNRP